MIANLQRTGPFGDETEDLLWMRAKDEQSLEAREALFNLHLPFARALASRHYRDRRTGDIDYQDLQQLACTGLLEAIDRFAPARGVPFRAYAGHRIAGVIINGVSKMSEMREQIAFRNRIAAERAKSLIAQDAAKLDAGDAMQALADLADLAAGLALGFMLETAGLISSENAADKRPNAYESMAWNETIRWLNADLARLSERENKIIRAHYMEGVSFEQLADLFGLSRGRISQLHRTAIERLRKRWDRADAFTLQR